MITVASCIASCTVDVENGENQILSATWKLCRLMKAVGCLIKEKK